MRRRLVLLALLLAGGAGFVMLWWSARAAAPSERPAVLERTVAQPAEPSALQLIDAAASEPAPIAAVASVAADQLAKWHGLVLDADGRPLAGARVGRLPVARTFRISSHGPQPSNPTLLDDAEWTETAADGSFTLAWAPPPEDTDWGVLVRHPRGVSHLVVCKDLLAGGGDLGTLRLAPGGTVRGAVLQPDMAPASGAEIELTAPYTLTMQTGDGQLIVGLREGLLHALADDGGRFAVGGLPAADYGARIQQRGSLPLVVEPQALASGGELDFGELHLQRGDTVSGRVVDAQGRPVAGAEVRGAPRDLELLQTSEHGIHFELEIERGAFGETPEREPFRNCVTTTDEQGRFVLGGLKQSHCGLLADAAGFEPAALANVPVGARDIMLTLTTPGRLHLRLLDAVDGHPLEDAELRVFRTWKSTLQIDVDRELPGQDELHVQKTGLGEFDVLGVCAAPLVAWVKAPALGSADLRLDGLAPDRAEDVRELRVPRPGTIAGRALDSAGAPLPSAVVRVEPYGLPDRAVRMERSPLPVDGDGRFKSGPLPAGAWAVSVSEPGRTWSNVRIDLAPGQDALAGDFSLQRLATLDVQVVDSTTGQPAGKLFLAASDAATEYNGFALATGWTTEDGTLRMSVAPVAVRLVCRDPPIDEVLAPLAEGETRPVTLHGSASARLSGIVSGASGPVSGARVVFKHAFGQEKTTTDEAGAWSLELKAALSGRLSASSARGGYVARHIELQSGDSRVENLSFGACTLRGRVVDETGAAMPGASVQVRRSDETLWGTGVPVDADGRFELADLEPGGWTLEAYAKDRGGSSDVDALLPDDASREILLHIDRLASVSGSVRGANGQDVARKCTVSLLPSDPNREVEHCFVKDDGTFRFELVAPGEAELVVARSLGSHEMDFDRERLDHLAWLRIPLHLAPGADVHQDITLPPDRP